MSVQNPSWINDNFTLIESALNGDRKSSLHEARRSALAAFMAKGLPTTKDEAWRYTNISPSFAKPRKLALTSTGKVSSSVQELITLVDGHVLVFLNGHFSPEFSRIKTEDGVVVESFTSILGNSGKLQTEVSILQNHLKRSAFHSDSMPALNAAFAQDGAFVRVGRDIAARYPIHIVNVATGPEGSIFITPRILIIVEENASAEVITSFLSSESSEALSNAFTMCHVAENARLNLLKLQDEADSDSHIGVIDAIQSNNSVFRIQLFSFGSALTRNEVSVTIDGSGAETFLDGLTVLDGVQHTDNHTVLNHAKPHSQSIENFKGIYGGKSRGVFCGTIIVEPDAQKTNAIQSNKTLLLSAEAAVDSQPQLKIWADDVKCTHGATVGQLDEDAIFYIRSRGISQTDARNLMIQAFAGDILQGISRPELKDYLSGILLRKLKAIR